MSTFPKLRESGETFRAHLQTRVARLPPACVNRACTTACLATVRRMSAWMNQIFRAGQANVGGVVRRNVQDVEKYVGLSVLLDECKRRGFHVVQTGDQLVILCNEGNMDIHC